MKEKNRNSGRWTEARFRSFIKSLLRQGSVRWGVIHDVKEDSFTEKKINPKTGRICKHYLCSCCREEFVGKDVIIDHIVPVVPLSGFKSWDDTINRMFCEADNLQVLCKNCHKNKCDYEREVRKEYARKNI